MDLQTTECKESKQCSPAKHHYDECVERVTGAGDDSKEDCVEECKSKPFPRAHSLCLSACLDTTALSTGP